MKNILLIAFSLFISSIGFSNNTGLFSVDDQNIQKEFTSINNLEEYLLQNPQFSYKDVQQNNPSLLTAANVESTISSSMVSPSNVNDGPLGIPSIIWGLLLSVIGLLIVYLTVGSGQETTYALIGCIIGTLIWGLSGILFWF
ncbi:MAG: hypothetical protein H0U27_09655 [Nitrosopumilus sp.]|nr:hypothetical protein [Nitrosopumilus sp.]